MTTRAYYIFFSILANKLRMDIVTTLKECPKNVSEISTLLNVEQSKISHALKSLKGCNIVTVKQKGKQRIYSLNKKTIFPILKLIDKHAKTYCQDKCCNK